VGFITVSLRYKFSAVSRINFCVSTNSGRINPYYSRPSKGQHLNLTSESFITRALFFDFGTIYNPFNQEAEVQNIPFNYSTDFIGVNIGMGARMNHRKYLTNPKINIYES
jgi:hypothetical protein